MQSKYIPTAEWVTLPAVSPWNNPHTFARKQSKKATTTEPRLKIMPPDCCCHSFVSRRLADTRHQSSPLVKTCTSGKQHFDQRSTGSRFIEDLFLICSSNSASVCSSSLSESFPLLLKKVYTVAMRQPSPLLTDWLTAGLSWSWLHKFKREGMSAEPEPPYSWVGNSGPAHLTLWG